MNDKTIALIQQLADKLGTTADHLWATVVKQAYVAAGLNVLWIAGVIAFLVLGLKWVRFMVRDIEPGDHDEPGYVLPWILYFTCGLFALITGYFAIAEFLTCVINPEYYAFKQITSFLHL